MTVLVPLGASTGFSCQREVPLKRVETHHWYGLEVIASAYNSVSWQTDSLANLAAWGDTLKPDMKVIAVSRDLLKYGLTHNTMVKIDTFPDTFYVKDKMHRKWRKRIDIYMGTDVKKAREWGKKKLMICYAVPKSDSVIHNNDE
ncbi:3D domain-containing protein [Allomuricauda sp. SCSIO 65647]|uniref:3D domain-containing protein n=1 Tax=Allomuricauda sp. SCSIO 65647 TaxID=2908843 RepID=UPI001F3FE154|nr:3D domain-containing protein [Muricauda sp. SCSIO 65647]UJH67298.1 3D domain-containing protein [Muricauda sp. SCSIO 65647]